MDINWDKLAWLTSTPRSWRDDLAATYEKIRSKPFWFVFWGGGVAGWRKDMSAGYLVRVGVIQANTVLFAKETAEWAPAVVCWFQDPSLSTSDAPMAALLAAIATAREAVGPRPDCQPFLDLLDNEDSSFQKVEIPVSLTNGQRAYASVLHLDPDGLPGGFIPPNRILPGFQSSGTPELIPPALYQ